MSEAALAGAGSTEAAAASAVPTPATSTPAAATADAPAPALGETLLGADAPPVDPAAAPVEGDGTKPAETKADDTAPDYSELKLPENVTADDPLIAAAKEAAAEHKLPAAAVQSLIDKVLPNLSAQIQELRDEPLRLAIERLKGWETDVKADPEIGGANLTAVKTNIARAMAQYGNPDEIKAALNETGAGSHPAIIRFLSRMSAALSEGTPVTNVRPAMTKQSAAARMYDNTNFSTGDMAAIP